MGTLHKDKTTTGGNPISGLQGDSRKPPVEIGVIVVSPMDEARRTAVTAACSRIKEILRRRFPDFTWHMRQVHREKMVLSNRMGPVAYLDQGIIEREANQWDFALLITNADLKGQYKPFALATPARSVSVAVLSLARLGPADGSEPEEPAKEPTVGILAQRIAALGLHLFCHLNDVPHSEDETDFAYKIKTVSDLDAMHRFSRETALQLGKALEGVADIRLEEEYAFVGRAALFYLRSIWHNRMDLIGAVLQIRPWRFPFYLSRLTTAAISSMLVMVITAEVWDLGMSQSPLPVLFISLCALAGTSAFIISRQRLLVRTHNQKLSEQRVVSNVSLATAILLGMMTTYLLLFSVTFLISWFLFKPPVVAQWAASVQGSIGISHHLVLSAFVAMLGIIIGALGASFEAHSYMRHIALVDEET